MEIVGKLVKKTFVNEKGEPVEYYVIAYELFGDEKVEVKIKGDKAKLILMNVALQKNSK